jgi:hypothetical protein
MSNKQTCQHLHQWIPIEWQAGARRYNDRGGVTTQSVDWSSNVINAHYLKATKIYCPECGAIRAIPSTADDS